MEMAPAAFGGRAAFRGCGKDQEELRGRLQRTEAERQLLAQSHADALAGRQADAEAHRAELEQRDGELAAARGQVEERERKLEQKRSALQQTAALGAQLTSIKNMLDELGGE